EQERHRPEGEEVAAARRERPPECHDPAYLRRYALRHAMPQDGPEPDAPLLSLVLPAYNASAFLAASLELLNEARRRWPPSEVIVVDDGSSDDTRAVAERFAAEGITCLRLPRNRGKGAAVRAGMRAARGAFRVFSDADLPYDLASVDTILRYLGDKE